MSERLTPEEVLTRVKAIQACAADDEVAHAMEDELHGDVLGAIAKGEATDPAECARIALTTGDLKFARWCA